MSVPNTLKAIEDMTEVLVDAVKLARQGIGFKTISNFAALCEAVVNLASDVPAAIPELESLGPIDTGLVASASYSMVQKIISSLK